MKQLKLKALSLPPSAAKRRYDVIDPIDGRYFDLDVTRILSEEARINFQAYVEYVLVHNYAEFGLCSQAVANDAYKAYQKVSARAVANEERKVKHDIKALVNVMKNSSAAKTKRFIHLAATSNDIVATAQALQTKLFVEEVLLPKLIDLERTLMELALKHSATAQIGRTHGQHGVPITFGFALAEYVNRLGSSIVTTQKLVTELEAKFSGAVGSHAASSLLINNPIEFEDRLLKKLGLQRAMHSTQLVPPQSLQRLFDEILLAAGAMANLAHDMRHLQRSEIDEVREVFAKNQTGSSTMAHKRNPVSFENVASLYKQVFAQSVNYKQNVISEHQRDLTDSASGRFYPVFLASVFAMTKRLDSTMKKIQVNQKAMSGNLTLLGGSIAAEPLYILLTKYGHPDAHKKAKQLSIKAIDSAQNFYEVAVADKEIAKNYLPKFSKKEIAILRTPESKYIGLTEKKTKDLVGQWRRQLQ